MGCGCKDKVLNMGPPTPAAPVRLVIQCTCGMYRMLPEALRIGDYITLVPCPKCSSPLSGKFIEGGIVEEYR